MNDKLIPPHVNRIQYALWGVGLMLLKYLVEYFVVTTNGGADYGLLQFVLPNYGGRIQSISGASGWVSWFILIWSLPFVFLAIWFSIGRALDAGLSPWIGLWILAPVVNMFFMIGMCIWPPTRPAIVKRTADQSENDADVAMWLTTILLGLLLTICMILLSIFALADYGATIFFSSPVLLGANCGYAHTKFNKQGNLGTAIGTAAIALVVGTTALIVLGVEGAVCIVMSLPIMLPATAIGGIIGFAIARSTSAVQSPWLTTALILPSAAMIEHCLTQPVQFEVVSVVEVDARPDEVWDTVVAFPEISAPPNLLSRLGVAYPVRARIEGQGVGAIRYCEFSTGDFVEPITLWSPPNRLAFDVQDQPCPLTELSPWEAIHPPHLDGFMQSHRGEFRIIELPGGRTRLEGHTWYSVDMYPQLYWKQWTDAIIHSIHHRVLSHIAEVVETQRGQDIVDG